MDDEPLIRAAVRRFLVGAGYTVHTAENVTEARTQLIAHDVDVLVSDVRMPDGSGVDLVREIATQLPDVAVVMLTGVDDPELAAEAFRLGAASYVVKPFGGNELLINVANALRLRDLERARRAHEVELERKLVDQTRSLGSALRRLEQGSVGTDGDSREAAERLAAALSLRHEETGRHIERVGHYAVALAHAHGMNGWTPDHIRVAAMLHDVGKLGIPDAVLLKTGPLDEEERTIIERHPELGHALLAGSSSEMVQLGASTALTHHERWDGTGYPQRLAGTAIPLEGRIAGLVDVFDAMTSNRSYHRPIPVDRTVEHIREQRGRHFDPDLVDLFVDLVDELLLIRAAHPDPDDTRVTSVLVVDDHPMYAESVVRLLSRDSGVEPIATAATGAAAVDLAGRHQPDVVLVDESMPGHSGLETALAVRRVAPASHVVLVTGGADEVSLADALRSGCAGYLLKSDGLQQLPRAVREVAAGNPVVPAGAMRQALGLLQHDRVEPVTALDPDELAVLGQLARGLGVEAAADLLGREPHEVRSVLSRAMAKLGARTRLEAVVATVRQGQVRVA